ncbi:prephenate dehydrogenase [Actinomyces sp. B33]|uniref:prephenate dehydrogenase n=1 Tax=Actinomyces sp. B33 TaxID=2942131 RepID=UPI0023427993|nr:prephenate dehydrogenase [Actinomyces sp. B33]MDC4233295.1 prephenate dehydrogenase [Actinomyces sp. B33]
MTPTPARPIATAGPVLIIGSGLLGASLGLCLRASGVDVYLEDASPTALRLAQDIGAGTPLVDAPDARPRLVVVATPPDVVDACVVRALAAHPQAVVTDVASVKDAVVEGVLDEAARTGDASLARRYVGSHPMAGRERSGAGAADADLFYGRPWVIVSHAQSSPEAVLAVRALAGDVGGVALEMDARTHDRCVALVSHAPQLVSSMLAARLVDAPAEALGLAGQGLRDTARIAASDPRLWTAILAGNAGPVAEILAAVRADLDDLIVHLEAAAERGPLRGGSVGAVNRVMEAGNRGVARIPGKHGGAPSRYAELEVLIPDAPGELGRLFTELGEIDVNIEDLVLEHSAGQSVGLARVMLDPARLGDASAELERRGWRIIPHAG